MYDDLSRISKKFQQEIENCRHAILHGAEFKSLEEYHVKRVELKTWELAFNYVEQVKKDTQKEI